MRLRAALVRQVAANLRDKLVVAVEEDGFLAFDEPLRVAGCALCQQEAAARRDFKALVHELVGVGVRKEAQVDLRTPDRPSGSCSLYSSPSRYSAANAAGVSARFQWCSPPLMTTGRPSLRHARKGRRPLVVGRADERDAAIALGVGVRRPVPGSARSAQTPSGF